MFLVLLVKFVIQQKLELLKVEQVTIQIVIFIILDFIMTNKNYPLLFLKRIFMHRNTISALNMELTNFFAMYATSLHY